MSLYRLDPPYDPADEDTSEVACCHWCHECIEPGTEREGNGWLWHARCIPLELIEGREQELRADERKHS